MLTVLISLARKLIREEEFVRLASSGPDTWDDSALIDAYDRAVSSHRLAIDKEKTSNLIQLGTPNGKPGGPAKKRKRRRKSADAGPTQTCPVLNQGASPILRPPSAPSIPTLPPDSTNAPNSAPKGLSLPPPPAPPGSSPDLEALLLAWYEAGYRAGKYVAGHSGGDE